MIAEVNLGIAVAIWVLSAFVAVDQWLEAGYGQRWRATGLAVFTLATVNLLSAAPLPLGLGEYSDAFRFVAAAVRSVALVLLIAYVLYRWERR